MKKHSKPLESDTCLNTISNFKFTDCHGFSVLQLHWGCRWEAFIIGGGGLWSGARDGAWGCAMFNANAIAVLVGFCTAFASAWAHGKNLDKRTRITNWIQLSGWSFVHVDKPTLSKISCKSAENRFQFEIVLNRPFACFALYYCFLNIYGK